MNYTLPAIHQKCSKFVNGFHSIITKTSIIDRDSMVELESNIVTNKIILDVFI
jgi:hypothetical protein